MQCASHLNLGWRINVTDPSPMSTTTSTSPTSITTTIAPPLITPVTLPPIATTASTGGAPTMISADDSVNIVSDHSANPPSSAGQLYSLF